MVKMYVIKNCLYLIMGHEMKGLSLINIGFLTFIILHVINRFVIKVSDPIYVAIMILANTFLFGGMLKIRKEGKR
ncbi:MAG: hypothetical protein TIS_03717 [Tissierella sp.]